MEPEDICEIEDIELLEEFANKSAKRANKLVIIASGIFAAFFGIIWWFSENREKIPMDVKEFLWTALNFPLLISSYYLAAKAGKHTVNKRLARLRIQELMRE